MRALAIAGKTLREMLREPLIVGAAFGFPLLLLLIYQLSFGKPAGGFADLLEIMVLRQDAGATVASDQLVRALRDERFEGLPVYTVVEVSDPASARQAVAEHKATALLVLGRGFEDAVARTRAGELSLADIPVSLVGSPGTDFYDFAAMLVDDNVHRTLLQMTGQQAPVKMDLTFLQGTGTMSDFDIGVPGIIVFGILLTIIAAAMTLVREHNAGTLRRLKLTRATASDLIGGVALAHVVQALVQVPLVLAVAIALGFSMKGSFALALLVGLLLALGAIGLGLVVACFARSDAEAANLGSLVMVPLAFLSGAMFPLPDATVLTVAGVGLSPYDLLPSTHATEALRQLMLHGSGLTEIGWRLGALALQALLLFALGVVLYRRLRMRAE